MVNDVKKCIDKRVKVILKLLAEIPVDAEMHDINSINEKIDFIVEILSDIQSDVNILVE